MTNYQEFIRISKYARHLDTRRETWEETLGRTKAFYQDHFKDHEHQKEILGFLDFYLGYTKNYEVMPSMRAIHSAGDALRHENAQAYNCGYKAITGIADFKDLMYLLMCGTGVGFSVESKYISQLPLVEPVCPTDVTIKVQDSREGWSEAFEELLDCLYRGVYPEVDFSAIRPVGSPLVTSGGMASGPEPLKELVQETTDIFWKAQGRQLTSLEVFDICMGIAHCVIAGGTRRSATICISDLDDEDMRNAKRGTEWQKSHPKRSGANISVRLPEGVSRKDFDTEFDALVSSGSGERGLIFEQGLRDTVHLAGRDMNHDFGMNPCLLGNTRLETILGFETIEDLAQKDFFNIRRLDGTFGMAKAWCTGIKTTIQLKDPKGREILVCTPDHKLMDVEGNEVLAKDSKGKRLMPKDRDEHKAPLVHSITDYGEHEVFDFSEPKFHWGFANGIVVHNCGEVVLRSSGQFCNLSEVVVRPSDSLEDLMLKAQAATFFGCIQATLTDFHGIQDSWTQNTEEERLLGVSLTGLRDHEILGSKSEIAKDWLRALKEVVDEAALDFSELLGIPRPTSVTSIKPSGTVSQLVDASSGLHPRYSRYYRRRVMLAAMDPLVPFLESQGMVSEPSKYSKSSVVFTFYQEAPEHSVLVEDIDALEQLEYWKMLKTYYTTHNPSITVYVKEHEWDLVREWVWENKPTGIALLPLDTHVYEQAPLEEISYEEYLEGTKVTKNLDLGLFFEAKDSGEAGGENGCMGGTCAY